MKDVGRALSSSHQRVCGYHGSNYIQSSTVSLVPGGDYEDIHSTTISIFERTRRDKTTHILPHCQQRHCIRVVEDLHTARSAPADFDDGRDTYTLSGLV